MQTVESTDYLTVRTRSGVRMVQHGTVLSEIRTTPGPTNSIVDVLAALIHVLAPDARVALLGFAGGGLIAPLRAMGGKHAINAVDLDDSGCRLFQRFCSQWAGDVRFEKADACDWLRQRTDKFAVILEDLSVTENHDVVKPSVTWTELPSLIHDRLTSNGVVIFNLLRPPECPWAAGIQRLIPAGFDSRVIHFTEFENRVLVVCKLLPSPRQLSSQLRDCLHVIQSRLTGRISVRSC